MKPRLLVVDDEPGMLRAVERVLARSCDIALASTADEALASAAASRPDLAILDIRMPDRDGFELMALLKEKDPDLDVILMTGSVTDTDRKLIRAVRENAFYFIQKPFDSEVMKTLVERCLEQRRLTADNRTYVARLEGELAEARVFQQSMLPRRRAIVGPATIHGYYEPCLEVGGDLYDYAPTADGGVALLVADVSGHGVSAAMVTGMVKSGFSSARADRFDPSAVVERIRQNLADLGPERFVTLFCARVSPALRLDYVNAGHPAGLLLRRGDNPIELESSGPIVSSLFDRPEDWESCSMPLSPGQELLLYTDGITEAPTTDGQFGEERLFRAVAESALADRSPVDGLLESLRSVTAGRPSPDDLTVLHARFGSFE